MSADSIVLAQYLRDRDVLQQKIDARLATELISPCGMAIGTDAKDVNFATPFSYIIEGTVYTKNKVVDAVTGAATVFGNPAAHNLFLASIDTAGTISFTASTSAVVANALSLPSLPSGECPIGLIYTFTASTATFTLGTTDFDAASVTTTFVDLLGSNGYTSLAAIGQMPAIPN